MTDSLPVDGSLIVRRRWRRQLSGRMLYECSRPVAVIRQQRVFDIDIERCACGGQLKIGAAIESRW
jgi:hypothetical protein